MYGLYELGKSKLLPVFLPSAKGKQNNFHSTVLVKRKKKEQATFFHNFNEMSISKAFKLRPSEYVLQSYPESRPINCGVQNCCIS